MHGRIALFVLIAGLSASVAPALAHHGRGGTYDMKRQVALKGTVAEVLWRNPHIVITPRSSIPARRGHPEASSSR